MGVKISLNSDDPGVFNTRVKAFDFFVAILAWELDLKDIKVININEFDGSLMSIAGRYMAKSNFILRWRKFTDAFLM